MSLSKMKTRIGVCAPCGGVKNTCPCISCAENQPLEVIYHTDR